MSLIRLEASPNETLTCVSHLPAAVDFTCVTQWAAGADEGCFSLQCERVEQ